MIQTLIVFIHIFHSAFNGAAVDRIIIFIIFEFENLLVFIAMAIVVLGIKGWREGLGRQYFNLIDYCI